MCSCIQFLLSSFVVQHHAVVVIRHTDLFRQLELSLCCTLFCTMQHMVLILRLFYVIIGLYIQPPPHAEGSALLLACEELLTHCQGGGNSDWL